MPFHHKPSDQICADQKHADHLLAVARQTYDQTPALRRFANWPDDLSFQKKPSHHVPAADHIKSLTLEDPLLLALKDAADHLPWKQSYRRDEVGQDFLDQYGFVELFGPDGIFHSQQCRGFIGYWGGGLYYPPHRHAAEEIYVVLHGTVRFIAPDDTDRSKLLYPGDVRHHVPYESHAMQVGDTAFLTFALWRGDAMAKPPILG